MHELVVHELKLNHRKFYTKPDLLVPASLEIAEQYGMDAVFVDYDVYNIEAEALGQAMLYYDDRIPEVDHTAPFIQSTDDLRKVTTPDFDSAGRCSQIIEMHHIYTRLTSLPPSLQFCAPFSLAANLCGTETLIKYILRNPDFAKVLLEMLTDDIIIPWIEYQKAHLPNFTGIAGADAMASVPIVNPTILAKWVMPNILRVRERCGPQVYVPNWVGERHLKNPREMLALKLQVSPGFLEAQDPDVAELGPEIFKTYAEEHQRPLVFGLGASFMENATPDEVRQRTQYYLEVGTRNNGGFALYLCNLSAATPPENIHTAIEIAHGWDYCH
jgi:uroporphyrinogen-III decarboxylase